MSERQRAKGATTGAVVLAAGSSERMQGANKLLARPYRKPWVHPDPAKV